MREYIDIKLILDLCIRKQKKKTSVKKRCVKNFGIENLAFKNNTDSFFVFLENGKIYFDPKEYIAKLYGVNNIDEVDKKLKQIAESNVLDIESILPEQLANYVQLEIEEIKKIKQSLSSMLIDDEILSTLQKKKQHIPYASKNNQDFFRKVSQAVASVADNYDHILNNAQKNNLYIYKLINQMDHFYSHTIRKDLLVAYINLKKELNDVDKKELTDAFVIENIQVEKLLYASLVSAYKNNNYAYLEKNIQKLTKGEITRLTEQIINRYQGIDKEFLENVKAFELAYGQSSIQKEDLLVTGANINTFNYNFLSLENKQEVDTTIKQMIKETVKKYQITQDDRYFVLLEKLQVLQELDIKELYIGKNSFEGYIGYKEENSNIMLEKYFEDAVKKVPAINEACYIVDKDDFDMLATHNKEAVIQMIKGGTIHAKRFYHNTAKGNDASGKRLFKDKILQAMRSHL